MNSLHLDLIYDMYGLIIQYEQQLDSTAADLFGLYDVQLVRY